VVVTGSGFGALEQVTISFVDTTSGTTKLGTVQTNASGSFTTSVTVPADAGAGLQSMTAKGGTSRISARQAFTVT
jgi:hypothetical protein